MKNVFKVTGIIAFAAIIGFSFATLSLTGCGGGDDGDGGIDPVMRTVTFDANGGTVEGVPTKAVRVEVGKTVKAPADPVNDQKIFWGWFDGKTEGEYGNQFDAATPIIWDMTVYARWGDTAPPPQFDVTFDANGGTYTGGGTTQIIKVYQGEKVTPPNPTRNGGYVVSGWNSQPNGTGTAFDKSEPVTEAFTVYAQWKKPEEMPAKDRWNVWGDLSSTATLENYSIDNDGLCTITVGGAPDQHGNGVWYAWKVTAQYIYTGKADKSYVYTFEAWTESGTRDLHVQYYEDNDEAVYIGDTIPITTTQKTYTIYGQDLPKGGIQLLSFQCADQLGTVHIKILEIKEFIIGTLTITNFSGNPGLTQNMDVYGGANLTNSNLGFFASGRMDESDDGWYQSNITIKGNTITIPVWEVNWGEKTVVPYTGNIIVTASNLELCQWKHTSGQWAGTDIYTNKVSITFTNGNATINFGTQMQKDHSETP